MSYKRRLSIIFFCSIVMTSNIAFASDGINLPTGKAAPVETFPNIEKAVQQQPSQQTAPVQQEPQTQVTPTVTPQIQPTNQQPITDQNAPGGFQQNMIISSIFKVIIMLAITFGVIVLFIVFKSRKRKKPEENIKEQPKAQSVKEEKGQINVSDAVASFVKYRLKNK